MVALAVLGASNRQRAGFLWTEAGTLTVAGLLGGLVTGALIAAELIKVLNGIFDPPPQSSAVPWPFVGAVVLIVVGTRRVGHCGLRPLGRPH